MLKRGLVLCLGALLLSACHTDNPLDPNAAAADAPPSSGTGTATVSWQAPTTTTTGTVLKDLAGYRIYYGLSETDLSQVVDAGVDLQTYVIENLGRGTWYFAVRAVTELGVESDLSQIVYKTID
jgi:hypothetical protein